MLAIDEHKKTMKRKQGSIRIRCEPHIKWSVESECVVLINLDKNEVLQLGYPEAAVWDLIQHSYSFEKAVKLLSAITLEDKRTTRVFLMKVLQEWREKGILIVEAVDG
jgi:hypothetical protein